MVSSPIYVTFMGRSTDYNFRDREGISCEYASERPVIWILILLLCLIHIYCVCYHQSVIPLSLFLSFSAFISVMSISVYMLSHKSLRFEATCWIVFSIQWKSWCHINWQQLIKIQWMLPPKTVCFQSYSKAFLNVSGKKLLIYVIQDMINFRDKN